MENLRFKFRAWDKTREQMINVDMLLNTENGMQQYRVARPLVNGCLDVEFVKEDTILMQYTGLKDKNGVEIYEGDIIKYDFNNLNYRIEFINAEFIARRFYENIENLYPTEFDYGRECEVIGNIYENPELLN